jgi:hypothetical protein
VETGCLYWPDGDRNHCILRRDFLDEYCAWQAIKFSIVDLSYESVCGPVRLGKLDARLGAVREA